MGGQLMIDTRARFQGSFDSMTSQVAAAAGLRLTIEQLSAPAIRPAEKSRSILPGIDEQRRQD